MDSCGIIYGLPFNKLVREKSSQEVGDILFRMMTSMLIVNKYYNDEITVYTDFEGMSILSILPFNFELIYYNTNSDISEFYKRVMKIQYKPFLLLNEKNCFKHHIDFTGNYVGKSGLIFVSDLPIIRKDSEIDISGLPIVDDLNSFDSIDGTKAREFIKEISTVFYDNFMNKINNKIDYK